MSAASIAPEQSAAWRVKAAVTLAELARHVLGSAAECPEYVTRAIVRVCCPHITDDGELLRLWESYLERVSLERSIEDGTIPWQVADDSLTRADRTEAAREIARQDAADALALLTGRTT